ncbi:MAG: glycosyltransferase family 4 protein [Patescibacteria group bacterium]
MKAPLRILFNDSHSNYGAGKAAAQGGPMIFADLFVQYSKDAPYHLTSVFFKSEPDATGVRLHKTSSKPQHDLFDVVYNRADLSVSYKQDYTKKAFLAFLSPWLEQIERLFDEARPDVVFLNGYALTNYLLFAIAKKRNIPVCIQHAGIWKNEINISAGSAFSPSIKKIFIGLEKDLVQHATHHVFLNSFSKERFLAAHKLHENDLYESSIIPLPIQTPAIIRPVTLKKKSKDTIRIGGVSRWDAIKNHSAFLRLAEYIAEEKIPATVSVVTNPFNGVASTFRDSYAAHIDIVAPMNTKKLAVFYRSCDVLLLPSKFETAGGVVMEAIIQGVPAIISDSVGWVPDYQSLGLHSLIVSPQASGKMLYAAIETLFNNKEAYIKRFASFQSKIIPRHDPKKIFPKYEKIFTSLSKKHHG